ncbi:helix-turn-helix domain-containing protein [Cyanobium gracile UHCC 0139]|uniref:Helix-turn-helix domain-containing protein n=1 Tax=Cyanobium gracile UHCC 0139 TaxID=3110308 RepID=A0ABU5RXM6_9CYAN|nr:helix-turn-helix domain-containing protein [Cyanobium gracile]MEA5392530.1 helix-turn-helix domain-containing protein [Cyanobium gracile UHCC 0139]
MTATLPDPEPSGGSELCPAELALQVMRGRWKLMILCRLRDGPQRFSALQRSLVGVSHKVLTTQLRELEADAVVCRRVFGEVPPRVEYDLSERGRALLPVLEGLHAWGAAAPPAEEAGE